MPGNDSFTKVLLHFNGTDASTTFTDSNIGGTTKTFTANGNAQIDTAQSKFGGASGLFDGTGDYLTSTDHADFEVSGDYTIDFWIRPNVLAGADRCIVSKSDSAGAGKYFGPYVIRYETASGNLVFYSSSDGTTWNIANAQSFGSISTSTWYHIAVVRSGNDYFLFKDGTQITTFSSSSTPINNTENFMIGRFVDTNDWNGWIEEFRLSNTARWTSGFTPPTAEYDTTQILTPSLYTDTDSFFTPKVSFKIFPSLYSDADVFNTHIIGVEQFLFPPYLAKHAYVAMVRQI